MRTVVAIATSVMIATIAVVAAGSRFSQWEVSAYNNAQFSLGALEGLGGESGVYLRAKSEAGAKQRLTIRGQAVRGPGPQLRVSGGSGAPVWYNAPNSEVTYEIDGGSKQTEVLVYGTGPYAYTLERADLEPCPDCLTADGLRQIVRTAIPGLDDLPELKRAEAILRWAVPHTDVEDDPKSDLIPALSNMTAEQVYSVWRADRSGASCGAFSAFLIKVWNAFGLSAFTVNFGVRGATHITAILNSGGRFYILDPTFNAVYRTKDGALADVETVLSRPDDVSFVADKVTRDARFFKGSKAARLSGIDLNQCSDQGDRYFCKTVTYDAVSAAFPQWVAAMNTTAPDPFRALLLTKTFGVSESTPSTVKFLGLLDRARQGERVAR